MLDANAAINFESLPLAQLERWIIRRAEERPMERGTVRPEALSTELLALPRTAAVWHFDTDETVAERGFTLGVGTYDEAVGSWRFFSAPALSGCTRQYRALCQYYYKPGASTTASNMRMRLSAATSVTWGNDPGAPYNANSDESFITPWAASTTLDALNETALFLEGLGDWLTQTGSYYVRYFEVQYKYVRQ